MKRILLTTIISFSSFAYANSGLYTSIKSGASDTRVTQYKNDFVPNSNAGNPLIKIKHNNTKETTYPIGSIAFGYDFSTISPLNIRTELEYTYKDKINFDPKITSLQYGSINAANITSEGFFSNELRSQSLMLNAYYDFKNSSKFTPYVSVGTGITRAKFTRTTNAGTLPTTGFDASKTNNNFTWSTGVGVAYQALDNVYLDLGYRYVNAGKVDIKQKVNVYDSKSSFKLSSHEYLVGIRYNF